MLPGAVVFALLWLIAFLRIDFGPWTSLTIEEQWQSLGAAALREDPFGSLTVLHVQPPGMNALYALDIALTPERHLLLAAVLLACGIGTVALLVDTLRRSGVPGSWAAGSGLLYALLPSSVLYALWGYVVAPVAFLATAAVWAVVLSRTRPRLGVTVSAFAVLGLVLIRPSFVWAVLVLWCIGLVVLLWRSGARRSWGLVGIGAALILGLGVQLHYVQAFGLPAMSSWSGENIAKALLVSRSLVVTPEARAQIDADPCMAQMLPAYEAGTLNRWDPDAFRGLPACAELPSLPAKGVAAWDEPTKADSGQPNFNVADRLVASRKWTEMMTIVVGHHPQQLVRMALTTEYGPTGSGLGLYLSPAENYPFITVARDALPTATVLGVLSLLYAPALFTLLLASWVAAAASRKVRSRTDPVFWFASTLLAFHLLSNTLLEFSENMRYRAEIDPVLLVAAMLGLWAMVGNRRDVRP